MLNLNNGPIAEINEWREAQEGKKEWEEVRLIRNPDEIDRMNGIWIREQFREDKSQEEILIRQPYMINPGDVIKAMNKIGKNKAPSYDGLMDIIFQK